MKQLILGCLFTFLANWATAQNPEKAEDISPLLVGENVPQATLANHKGETIDFQDLIKKKPSIVLFYRGGWCPYCNLQLAGIQEIEKELLDLGYQILAISPDDAQHLTQTVEKKALTYDLLSDADMTLAKKFGIAFQAPEKYKKVINIKKHSGGKNTENLLPVPAVFLVDTEGVIQFEYINPNFKVRLHPELLKAAAKIQKESK